MLWSSWPGHVEGAFGCCGPLALRRSAAGRIVGKCCMFGIICQVEGAKSDDDWMWLCRPWPRGRCLLTTKWTLSSLRLLPGTSFQLQPNLQPPFPPTPPVQTSEKLTTAASLKRLAAILNRPFQVLRPPPPMPRQDPAPPPPPVETSASDTAAASLKHEQSLDLRGHGAASDHFGRWAPSTHV